MQIRKKLDTDHDIEFLDNGVMAHASNVVINGTADGILAENAIKLLYKTVEEDEKIVGLIPCSDEIVFFTNKNKIYRFYEKTNEVVFVPTNWNWNGGKVIGAYTYNVRNDLIISITEINTDNKVPLKLINLNKPFSLQAVDDNKYTLTPDIPKTNLNGWDYISGNNIYKGSYVFFIRYKLDDENYTGWQKIGSPILVYDETTVDIENYKHIENIALYKKFKSLWRTRIKYKDDFSILENAVTDVVNSSSIKTPKNIQLNLDIIDKKDYKYYQIGYIVNTVEHEVKVFTTKDYKIDNITVVIDNVNNDEVTLDEITSTAFNLFNVKTLCNYRNRLYVANFEEENRNKDVDKIDVSNIKVSVKEPFNVGKKQDNSIAFYKDIIRDSDFYYNEDGVRINRIYRFNYNYHLAATDKKYDITKRGSIITNKVGINFHYNFGIVIPLHEFLRSILFNEKKETTITYDSVKGYYLFVYKYKDGSTGTQFIYDPNASESATYFDFINAVEKLPAIQGYNLRTLFYEEHLSEIITNNVVTTYGINEGFFNYISYKEATLDSNAVNFATGNNINEPVGGIYIISYNIKWEDIPNADLISFGDNYQGFLLHPKDNRGNIRAFNITKHHRFNDPINLNITICKKITDTDAKVLANGILKHTGNVTNIIFPYITYITDERGLRSISTTDYAFDALSAKKYSFNHNVTIANNGTDFINALVNYIKNCRVYYNYSNNKFGLMSIEEYNGASLLEHEFKFNKQGEHIADIDVFIKQYLGYDTPNIKYLDGRNINFKDNDIVINNENVDVTTEDFKRDVDYSLKGTLNYNKKQYPVRIKNLQIKDVYIKDGENYNKKFALTVPISFLFVDNKLIYNVSKIAYINNGLDTIITANLFDLYIAFVKNEKNATYETYIVQNNYLNKLVGEPINTNTFLTIPTTSIKLNSQLTALQTDNLSFDIKYGNIIETEEKVADIGFYQPIVKNANSVGIYNFFIHYVYANGNYTDGIRINNNIDYSQSIEFGKKGINVCRVDINIYTTISEAYSKINAFVQEHGEFDIVKPFQDIKHFAENNGTLYFYNVYPFYINGIAPYINSNGDVSFRGIIQNKERNGFHIPDNPHPISFAFDNIPLFDNFVGYFISYEKPESIYCGTGVITNFSYDIGTNKTINSKDNTERLRFYNPLFNLTKKNVVGNLLYKSGYKKYTVRYGWYKAPLLIEEHEDKSLIKNDTTDIARYVSCEIIPFNHRDNMNRETIVRISPKEKILSHNLAIDIWGDEVISNFDNIDTNTENKITYGEKASLMPIPMIENQVWVLTFATMYNIHNNLYIRNNKELVPLGYVKYYNKGNNISNYGYENYPYNYDFYYDDTTNVASFRAGGIVYDEVEYPPIVTEFQSTSQTTKRVHANRIVEDEAGTDLNDKGGRSIASDFVYPLTFINIPTYSQQPTFVRHIKEEPVNKYYTFAIKETDFIRNELTSHIYPTMYSNLYEIKPCYFDHNDKLVVNYNTTTYNNFISKYPRTIRRSDVLNDETVKLKWRNFRSGQYKVINENKGDITNVIGVGIYLIAHCEHSLFVFNRDNTMQTQDKNIQILMPDTFDIDYTEMFTSTKGNAGLQQHNFWSCSGHGYIFYDKNARKIYRFDNNSLDEISSGMRNLFEDNILDLNMAIDPKNDRLVICGLVQSPVGRDRFAISYSFFDNAWISTHDYYYEDLINTKDNIYFIAKSKGVICNVDTNRYNSFEYNNVLNLQNHFASYNTNNLVNLSFVDIVFNNAGIDKVLNYITYLFSWTKLNDGYSGNTIIIYTNDTCSGEIDVTQHKNSVDEYTLPRYNYGTWHFNWFRNKLKHIYSPDYKYPIDRHTGKVNTQELQTNNLDNKLIVGKWFVVRIVYGDTENRLGLNDIQCY